MIKISESNIHLKAKKKLFNLIVAKRVKLKDQFNKTYNIFDGIYKNEFLHVESFLIGKSKYALLTNKSPCFDYKIDNPLCDQNGHTGAFRRLPCKKCLEDNLYIDDIYADIVSGYRPDISWGYNNEHKIWIEVKYKNGISENKIKFCNAIGIKILEFNAKDILKYNDLKGDQYLIGNLIIDCNSDFDNDKRKLKSLFINKINSDGYINSSWFKKVAGNLISKYSSIVVRDLINELNCIEINGFIGDGISQYLNLKNNKNTYKIIVFKSDYENKYKKIQDKYMKNIENKIDTYFKNIKNDVIKNRFLFVSNVRKEFEDILPYGEKNNFKNKFNKMLDKYELVNFFTRKYEDGILNKINIDYCGLKNVIITKRDYLMLTDHYLK